MKFFAYLLSAIFPKRCPFCGKTMEPDKLCCDDCFEKLSFVEGKTCPICGRGVGFCSCGDKNFAFDRCVSPFYYEDLVRNGIIAFKFRQKPIYCETFADFAVKTVKKEYNVKNISCVTSVPLTSSEKKERGFNQSELFARKVAVKLSLPYYETLLKVKDIKPQRTLGQIERKSNVKGAFRYKKKLSGTILLVDDILTTGATLDSCAKELKAAGAEKVLCVTIASTKFEAEKGAKTTDLKK